MVVHDVAGTVAGRVRGEWVWKVVSRVCRNYNTSMNPSNQRNGETRRWKALGRVVSGGVMFLAATAVLPGCIAWEIRDGIREANGHMANVDCRIDDANSRLDLAHAHIDQTNALLIEVRTELAQTNTRLGEMEGQLLRANPMIDVTNKRLDDLMVLREVQATLTKINTQLKPLGDSLSALGSTVSFLGFGGDGGEGAETAGGEGADATDGAAVAASDGEAAATGVATNTEPAAGASPSSAGATTASATGGAGAGTTTTASSRRSPNFLLGTWLLAYPTEDGAIGSGGAVGAGSTGSKRPNSAAGKASSLSAHAVIFLSSGEYILAEPDKPTIRGTWAREGKTLTMTAAPTGAAAVATGAQTGTTGNAAMPGSTTVVEILNNSPRQLTVKVGEEIRVYTRP